METVPGPSFFQYHDPNLVLEKGGNQAEVDAAWDLITAIEKLEGFRKVSRISIVQFIFLST
jgi:hypothetical protein